MTPTSKPEQAASVDQLITTFKRRGHFDILRKSALQAFQSSVMPRAALLTRKEEWGRANNETGGNRARRSAKGFKSSAKRSFKKRYPYRWRSGSVFRVTMQLFNL